MEELNTIAFIVREGYEIKTWLYVSEDERTEVTEQRVKDQFISLGVEVKDDDMFDYDGF